MVRFRYCLESAIEPRDVAMVVVVYGRGSMPYRAASRHAHKGIHDEQATATWLSFSAPLSHLFRKAQPEAARRRSVATYPWASFKAGGFREAKRRGLGLPHQQARPAQLSDQPELLRSSPDGKCWQKCHWPGYP